MSVKEYIGLSRGLYLIPSEGSEHIRGTYLCILTEPLWSVE